MHAQQIISQEDNPEILCLAIGWWKKSAWNFRLFSGFLNCWAFIVSMYRHLVENILWYKIGENYRICHSLHYSFNAAFKCVCG